METLFQPRTDVFDPERVAPPRINIADYSHLWINVLTLIRNAYNAVGREEAYAVTSHDMAEVILQEMGGLAKPYVAKEKAIMIRQQPPASEGVTEPEL
jgi:hypothetical protein